MLGEGRSRRGRWGAWSQRLVPAIIPRRWIVLDCWAAFLARTMLVWQGLPGSGRPPSCQRAGRPLWSPRPGPWWTSGSSWAWWSSPRRQWLWEKICRNCRSKSYFYCWCAVTDTLSFFCPNSRYSNRISLHRTHSVCEPAAVLLARSRHIRDPARTGSLSPFRLVSCPLGLLVS